MAWDVIRIVLFPAPVRFPHFDEHAVTSLGSYESPQWSSDSRYLAYFSEGYNTDLVVYDTLTKANWTAASGVSSVHFSWTPDDQLSYLRYRPDLSGSPFPTIHDLYQSELDGGNERVIAKGLSSPGDFDWFSDGIHMAILLTNPEIRNYDNDVYLLNTNTSEVELLVEADDVGLGHFTTLVLTPDEKSIFVYGIEKLNGSRATATSAKLILYDLETRTIRQQVFPSELMRPGNTTYPWPGIGDGRNANWVGGQRWFLAKAVMPDANNECYNYSLYFFHLENPKNSFCIPTVEGIINDPVISPDLKKISYITMVGPGNSYLMLGTVPPDLVARLE